MFEPTTSKFSSACLWSGEMPEALDGLARLGSADGAVLVHSRHNVTLQVVASAALVSHVADYVAGDRPTDPRSSRVNPGAHDGFRLDQDDFSLREIALEPFYQDFLRPRGLGWHACALLSQSSGGDALHFSLKRSMDRGPFSQDELAQLSRELPAMRMAVQFTQAATAMMDSVFQAQHAPSRHTLIGYDSRGEAVSIVWAPGNESVIRLRHGTVQSVDPAQQGRLNAAVARAHAGEGQAAVILTDRQCRRWSFRIRRWGADPQINMAYLAVVTPLDDVVQLSEEWLLTIRDLFEFSHAEARIAALIGQGLSVPAIAKRLAVSPGTVRNQLKAVFAKAGVSRQAELSLLLSRL